MSRTFEDNKELQSKFMEIWRDGRIRGAEDLDTVRGTVIAVEKAVRATKQEFAAQIKQGHGMITDAETRIRDICKPLDEVLLVAGRLINAYEVESKTDTVVDAIVDIFEGVTGTKPKPNKKVTNKKEAN